MHSRVRDFAVLLIMIALPAIGSAAIELEAVTVGFSEAWTGNAYVPPAFDVTGSEETPIDAFARAGARFSLLGGPADPVVLSLHPALQLGMRYYVLFASGRVAPAPLETSTGFEEEYGFGLGSARFLTFRLQVPVALELRMRSGQALSVGISPTGVFRVRGGHVESADDDTDLSGFYRYFYGGLRFLMPEASVGYRFPVGDRIDTQIHATYGLSVVDLLDPVLPAWHEMRLELGVIIGFTRWPWDPQELEGIDDAE